MDGHAHPLELPPRALDLAGFRSLFTEAQREPERVGETVFYRWAVRELAGTLELDAPEHFPESEEAVLSARASDPAGYARRLLSEANLQAVLLDTGFGGGGPLEDHEPLFGGKAYEVLRVESVAGRLLPGAESAGELLDAVEEALLGARDAVGFKSVVAYRAGLSVPLNPLKEELDPAFEAEKAAGEAEVRIRRPELLGALLVVAARVAGRTGKPLQVHTGFGDEDLDLVAANPALLKPLLDHPEAAGAPVVILHAYPYVRQAGWLASLYPNVYLDLSLTVPLTAHAAEDAISAALELAPWRQLLYASDGFIGPELFFLGARRFRAALSGVLEDLIRRRFLISTEVESLVIDVMRDNARRLYAI